MANWNEVLNKRNRKTKTFQDRQFVNDTEFVETSFGKLASKRLLQEIGQLREDTDFDSGITDLKQRVVNGGLRNG